MSKENTAKFWAWSVFNSDLPSYSKYLVNYLGLMMGSGTTANPSLSFICDQTSLSKSTVVKYLQVLEDNKWLERIRGDSETTTVYFALFPKGIKN